MKTATIGKRIFYISGFLCLVIALLSFFAINRMLSLKAILTSVTEDSLPGLACAGDITAGLALNQLHLFHMLASASVAEHEKIKAEIAVVTVRITEDIKRYEATVVNAEDRANLDALNQKRSAYIKARDSYLVVIENNPDEAKKIITTSLRDAYLDYSKTADVLMEYNRQQGEANGKALASQVGYNVWIISVGSIICLLLGIAASILGIRSIVKILSKTSEVLGEGSNQVASAAKQITSTSQSLAEGSSEQAASLEETSSSLEEMASMTKQNSENAGKAKDLANEARQAADLGANDMQTMDAAMEAIRVSSNDIAKIIKTIDEIAFQTNILALNAAVEAARAGEAGMGFAVVAEEVRNLAQRSAQAARETAEKIEGAISKSDQGVAISSKVGQTLQEIVTKVRKVDELITEVASASREQTQGIEQVTVAVSQMDRVTQSNAASAEESASASQELNSQAQKLKDEVTHLLALVGHHETTQSPGASAPIKPVIKARPSVQVNTSHAKTRSAGALPQPLASTNRSSEIPMDDDFTDFKN